MNRLFIKLLSFSGIPFGLIIAVLLFPSEGFVNAVLSGILTGLMFGTIISYIIIILHRSLCRRVAPEGYLHDYEIHQKRVFLLDIPFDKAFAQCLKSLHVIRNCRVVCQDQSQGEIHARAGINWKTWGDDITFTLMKRGDNTTVVTISSSPAAGSTLVDFGKNLDNVERLKRFLLDSSYEKRL